MVTFLRSRWVCIMDNYIQYKVNDLSIDSWQSRYSLCSGTTCIYSYCLISKKVSILLPLSFHSLWIGTLMSFQKFIQYARYWSRWIELSEPFPKIYTFIYIYIPSSFLDIAKNVAYFTYIEIVSIFSKNWHNFFYSIM